MNNKKCIECGGPVTAGWGLIRDRPRWKIFTTDEEWAIQCQAKIANINEKCYGCVAYGKNGVIKHLSREQLAALISSYESSYWRMLW